MDERRVFQAFFQMGVLLPACDLYFYLLDGNGKWEKCTERIIETLDPYIHNFYGACYFFEQDVS